MPGPTPAFLLLFRLHKRITRVHVKWAIKMSLESLAHVSQLQAWKTVAETYRDFHPLYGVVEEEAAILLNRGVRIDETGDCSMHLAVVQRKGSGGFMTRVDGSGRPEYRVHYDPRETLIATSDGGTISTYRTTYHTQSVQGIYRGHNNRTYNPAHEHLQISFVSRPDGEMGKVEFNLSSGRGSFSLGGQVLGWILGREESARLRYEALTTELAMHLGHTAVGF